MLKIGEFSKLSRVSVRMLRHYDEIGLLKPAEIDRFTDYRYYREDQLPTMCRITGIMMHTSSREKAGGTFHAEDRRIFKTVQSQRPHAAPL